MKDSAIIKTLIKSLQSDQWADSQVNLTNILRVLELILSKLPHIQQIDYMEDV